MTKYNIVAAVVDTQQLTMYKEDGSTLIIKQGDDRLRPIVDQITPILLKNEVATIDFDHAPNPYNTFEEKSSGLVKFFRVAKKVVSSLFGSSAPVEPAIVGRFPGTAQADDSKLATAQVAINDIMAHAIPAGADNFSESFNSGSEAEGGDTIIAVVNNKVVPGVEKIQQHVSHSARLGSTLGTENFLRRISAVVEQRGHTVQELLRFMEKGDLPIADDGSIIAYKVLRSTDKPGVFVDCHTKKVHQRVGSFVCQDKVDESRRQECASGLHVARRAYIGCFPGDIITLIKVAPEDVVAVPHGEPNKMRARGYHIIGVIPPEIHGVLRSNKPMTSDERAAKLLGAAIKGQHPARLEEVRIRGASGNDIVTTQLVKDGTKKETSPSIKNVEPVKAIDDRPVENAADMVDPKAVSKEVAAHKAAAPQPVPAGILVTDQPKEAKKVVSPRQERAQSLLSLIIKSTDPIQVREAVQQLLAHKKAAKVSWTSLGLSEDTPATIERALSIPIPEPKAEPTPKVPNAETRAAIKELRAGKATKPIKELNPTAPKPPKETTKMTGTRAEVARVLFDQAAAGDKSRWGSLWQHQKECKKSWTILGFNAREIERIKTNKPDWV